MNHEADFLLGADHELTRSSVFDVFRVYSWLLFPTQTNRMQWRIAKNRHVIKHMYVQHQKGLTLNIKRVHEVDARISENRSLYAAHLGIMRAHNLRHIAHLKRQAVVRGRDVTQFTEAELESCWTPDDRNCIENMEVLNTALETHVLQREIFATAASMCRDNMGACVAVDSSLRTSSHFVDLADILRNIDTDTLTKMIETHTSKTHEVFEKMKATKDGLGDVSALDNAENKEAVRAAKVANRAHRTRVLDDMLGAPSGASDAQRTTRVLELV